MCHWKRTHHPHPTDTHTLLPLLPLYRLHRLLGAQAPHITFRPKAWHLAGTRRGLHMLPPHPPYSQMNSYHIGPSTCPTMLITITHCVHYNYFSPTVIKNFYEFSQVAISSFSFIRTKGADCQCTQHFFPLFVVCERPKRPRFQGQLVLNMYIPVSHTNGRYIKILIG